ncbi:hypothetical protein PMIN06_003839 [Paraphaeosphaeria minitans]
MGGGPKASAANLEPLGKRRRFGNPADYSSTKACASPAHEVRSVNDMAPISSCAKDSRSAPLLSTAQTTTSHTESKVNATLSDTASAQVGKPSVSYLPNAEPPSSTTGTAATGPIVNRRNVKDSHEPIKRAPSPRTRLETSARALALAQEWQAKFKALPKKPPMPYSLHQVITREQSVRMVNERSMLNKPVPQPSPFGKSELQGRDSIATGEIDEEPRKRRRKSGPESQASAANLEPLGGSRRGYFPNTSADGSPNLSGFQQQSSQVTPVDMPALGIQKPKPDVSVDAVGLSRSTQHIPVDLETVAAPKNLTTKAEDVGRSAAREFQCPLPPRNDTHLPTRNEKTGNEKTGNEKTGNEKAGDDDRFEDDFRKRKRTRSPYRPRDDYKEAGHREDPDQRHDSSRDRLLTSVLEPRRGTRTSARTSKTIVTATGVLIRDLEITLFVRGLLKDPTLISEIVLLRPVGPIMTDKAIATMLEIVETITLSVERTIYTPTTARSSDPGLTIRTLSIGIVTRDIPMMKHLDQLDTNVVTTNNHDHLINTFVPNTDSIIVVIAYTPWQENIKTTDVVRATSTGVE